MLELISVVSLCQQDSQFVVNYCINAPWPLYETTREMLNYAKVRVRALFISISSTLQLLFHPSVQLERDTEQFQSFQKAKVKAL